MMTKVWLIGCSHESLTCAIWLASIGRTVALQASEQQIGEVLASYKFDHQMSALWQMYQAGGQISVVDEMAAAQDIWLFADAVDLPTLQPILQAQLSAGARLIISGSQQMMAIAQFAEMLPSTQICYVPFVFIKDGAGFASMSSPDLVMVGEKCADSYQKNPLVLSLLSRAAHHYVADIRTIEFARSTIMAMLATRLSFINEMARLADASGVDITKVQAILGLDKRIGKDYLSAGWGFGGRTLPSEIALLDEFFKQNQVSSHLLSTVSKINEDQKELLFRKFWRHFDGFIDEKTVVIWGAGYRSGTGRTTNSAVHPLLNLLWSYGIKTRVYAPNAGFELLQMYREQPLFSLIDDAYALAGADALFILNWSDALPPDASRLSAFDLPIFDGKNLLQDATIGKLNGEYRGVGRKK